MLCYLSHRHLERYRLPVDFHERTWWAHLTVRVESKIIVVNLRVVDVAVHINIVKDLRVTLVLAESTNLRMGHQGDQADHSILGLTITETKPSRDGNVEISTSAEVVVNRELDKRLHERRLSH